MLLYYAAVELVNYLPFAGGFMSIEQELKALEEQEARLGEQRQRLLKEMEEEKKRQEKLDSLVEKSGYATPKALVEALIQRFNIQVGRLQKGSAASKAGKRTRTRVDASLRDKVRKAIDGGMNYSEATRQFGISYPVVKKIVDGGYDNL
jgi:predicted aldo/keto reductase-like oxidoreductase